ncbi:hypothetical protein [Nonomuraea sp. NPDC005692]|uniref:hypothetical protein n=1 Tax=Nonomuraea sp. NPDC005692 TaxID=3157168 RepID=UPI0033F378A5
MPDQLQGRRAGVTDREPAQALARVAHAEFGSVEPLCDNAGVPLYGGGGTC